jgi:tuberous sclerosis protein 2
MRGGNALDRAIQVLDQVPTLDTHKIGVLYVGPGQTTGTQILANVHGSPRLARQNCAISQF